MNKISLDWIERKIAVLGAVLYSGAILTLVITGGVSEGELTDNSPTDNSLANQIFLIFYVITFCLLAIRWQKALYIVSKNIYILLLTLLVICSTFWSISPIVTANRAICLLGTNLFGLYFASRYTLKQQLLLLAQAFGIIILLSLLLAVFIPKYGIMGGAHVGAWRGVFDHKNLLGRAMGISTIIFVFRSVSKYKTSSFTYLGLIFSVILLILSKSSSPLINLVIVAGFFLALNILRWDYILMVPAFFATTLITSGLSIWYNDNSAILFNSFGKDSNLSGRTELWNLAWKAGLKRPWQGYGYGGFWDVHNDEIIEILRSAGWSAPNAHNGFLDFFLGLGVLGAVILALSFIDSSIRAFFCLRYTKFDNYEQFWPLIFMLYFLISNLSESGLMIHNNLLTVIYVTISYSTIINTDNRAKAFVIDATRDND